MANPKFLSSDLSAQTFGWSAGVNASYPLSNLQTYYPDQKSRSNGVAAGQSFTFQYPTGANLIILEGTNFGSLGTTSIKIQYDAGGGSWQDEATVTATNNAQAVVITTHPVSDWRILFNKGSDLSAAPEIGNFFIGTSFDFSKTQEWGFVSDMPDFKTSAVRTLDGRMDTALLYGFSRHEIEFKLITDALVTSWRAFLRLVSGNAVPFYYIDNNSAIWLVNFEKSFNMAKAFRYNQNDIARFTLVSTMGE